MVSSEGNSSGNVVSAQTPSAPMMDKAGNLTFAWLKWFQNMGRTINNTFTQQGTLQPQAAPSSQPTPTPLTAATVAGFADAGGADGLPATPQGYLVWTINGTPVKVPFYNI